MIDKFAPKSFEEAQWLAGVIASSGLFPAAKTQSAAFVLLATGAELDLRPMQAMLSLQEISPSTDAIVAMVKRSPLCQYFRLVSSSEFSATYETHRLDEPIATSFTYKIEDAKTAGLTDRAIWQKHPAAMLRARCASTLARIVYPDVMLGQDPDVEVENAQRSVSINGKVMDVRLSPPVQLPPEAPTPPKPTVRPTKQPPKQKLTQEQKAQHALALKGMGTREAAKHIAADLSAHGIGPSPQEAIRVIADCCEKRGISPHQATIDDLFAAWMELLS